MSIIQKRRDEVLSFLQENDKTFTAIGNLYHAEKAFVIFSVYDYVCEQYEQNKINEEDVNFYMNIINKFIKDEVELKWNEDNTLYINYLQELDNDE